MTDRSPQEMLDALAAAIRRRYPNLPNMTAVQLGELSVRASLTRAAGGWPCEWCGRPVGSRGAYRCDDPACVDWLRPARQRIEFGIRYRWTDGTVEDVLCDGRQHAERRVALHARKRAEDPGYRAAVELIQRTVTTGPWTTTDTTPPPADSTQDIV